MRCVKVFGLAVGQTKVCQNLDGSDRATELRVLGECGDFSWVGDGLYEPDESATVRVWHTPSGAEGR